MTCSAPQLYTAKRWNYLHKLGKSFDIDLRHLLMIVRCRMRYIFSDSLPSLALLLFFDDDPHLRSLHKKFAGHIVPLS